MVNKAIGYYKLNGLVETVYFKAYVSEYNKVLKAQSTHYHRISECVFIPKYSATTVLTVTVMWLVEPSRVKLKDLPEGLVETLKNKSPCTFI